MIDRERERSRDIAGGRSRLHAGSPTWDSIPGLDPWTPGSRPGPKVGTKPLSHPGIPSNLILKSRDYSLVDIVVNIQNEKVLIKSN